MRGKVLVIAGSDSGGGAGIQADIKAITMLGAFATTSITAITAQNTLGVSGVHAIPAEIVTRQIRAVLEDLGADVIKTGMLLSATIVEATVEALVSMAPDTPVVVDPVMIAKGGAPLLDPDATQAVISKLVPRAALLTPNIPEAAALSGTSIASVDDMIAAGERLLALGPAAVLVKGGHLESSRITDVLLTRSGERAFFESDRIVSRHTHGTGCTLASAIAAGLAQSLPLRDAVERARDYVLEAIRTAPGFGAGHGPLNHAHPLTRHSKT